MGQRGDPIKCEVVSTDASGAGVKATIYKAGSATAYTPTAKEFISITDIIFISTAGGVYNILAGTSTAATDTAGLRIAKGNADVLGGLAHHFETPVVLPVGYVPWLIAAAGQVDLVLTGYVNEV
jgi:hypothetical protein